MPVTIKASLYKSTWRGNPVEIRRFSVDEVAAGSYEFLLEQVAKVFPSVTEEKVVLAWVDEDGDTIVISSDDELAQALDYYKGKLFRLYVKADLAQTSENSGSDNDESTEQKRGPFHPGVICDGCNGGIYGSRFKCLICTDYDLCSACEGQGVHGDHNMVELERPFQFGPFCGPPFAGGWFGQPGVWRSGGCHRGGRGGRRGGYGSGGGPWSWNPSFQEGCPYKRSGAGGRCGGRSAGPWFPGEGRQCKPPESKPREDQAAAEPEAMDTDLKGSDANEDDRRKYLRNVGSAVSSFLEPFGIKVDVDVVGDGDDKKTESDGAGASEGGTASVNEEALEIALAQLSSMGYEDEGGWLTELVKAKGGDVAKVLDALHPAGDEPEAKP